MAYVANMSFWDGLHGEASTLEEEAGDPIEEMELRPGRFALAPVQNPKSFACRLFGAPSRWMFPLGARANLPPPRVFGTRGPAGCNAALAPKKGTTTLGFVYQGGVIIAVDSRASMGTFISSQTVRKVLEISDVILGTMAGGAADCSYWERYLSKLCRLYELRNQEKIPVSAASNLLANIFYSWRGYGLCCGTMIAGWNASMETPELYFVDDKATRLKGNMFSCGSGSTFAYGVLDNSYRWDLTDEDAVELGRRAIYHAAHRDGGSGGVCRVYHCHRGGWTAKVEAADVTELHYKYAQEKGEDGRLL